jgi:hypothetical protein
MMEQDTTDKSEKSQGAKRQPDDKGFIQIDAYVKIWDPKSQEVLVEVRE